MKSRRKPHNAYGEDVVRKAGDLYGRVNRQAGRRHDRYLYQRRKKGTPLNKKSRFYRGAGPGYSGRPGGGKRHDERIQTDRY